MRLASIRRTLVTTLGAFAISATVTAQAPASGSAADKALIPLKVQVTISRVQSDKTTSRLPFTLWVNANDHNITTMNAGMSIPVPQGTGPVTNVSYQSIGTMIGCGVASMDDGRFKMDLSINDSNVVPGKDQPALVTMRSLSLHNFLVLRDGQTAEFATTTDKVSGEVTKVDVVVSVLK